MKYSKSLIIICLATTLFVFAMSCKKEFAKLVVEDTDLSDKAFVKVYNGTISSQRTRMYVDNIGISGTLLAYGGIFPSSTYAAALTPGSHTIEIKDTVATSSQPPISISANLEAGKNYSIFTYDTVNSIKYIMTTDQIEKPTDTTARLRFVNLIFSKATLPNVDLFSVNRGVTIFSNVPIGKVSDFIPFASRRADTICVRATGTTVNLTPLVAINPTINRSYTIIYRGRYETTSGTAMPRGLSAISNY